MVVAIVAALGMTEIAAAQSLGTFRWQLQPYCNVITVTVTLAGGVYRLEGTDDQCGAGRDLAAVQGLAFPNPDGTVGFGLTIVTPPSGTPVHVNVDIALATLNGSWRDSTGAAGTFTLTPGSATGGAPRPQARPSPIPQAIRLLDDGGLVAGGATGSAIPAAGAGTRMMWYPGKAAFRSGSVNGAQWDEANVGQSSVAMGSNTRASGASSVATGFSSIAAGEASVAMGSATTASGAASVAMGERSVASGNQAVAMGFLTAASGPSSAAFGDRTKATGAGSSAFGSGTTASGSGALAAGIGTTASGASAVALGDGTTASGAQGVALGYRTAATGNVSFAFGTFATAGGHDSVVLGSRAGTTPAATGSFMFADRSSNNDFISNLPNEFGARFAGGYFLYTRANLSAGIALAPGGSSWAALSDVNAKENFADIDGEDLLARLARVPVRSWNYKSQGTEIRHMGPTAQDFRAAFEVGDFPLRINTIDADGIALAGVKALDARTAALRARVDELRRENDHLRQESTELRAKLAQLETALERK